MGYKLGGGRFNQKAKFQFFLCLPKILSSILATYVAINKFMLSRNFTILIFFIWHEQGQEELSLLKIGESSAKCLTLSTPLWVQKRKITKSYEMNSVWYGFSDTLDKWQMAALKSL